MHKEIIKILKDNNIDAFSRYPQGRTPINFAVIKPSKISTKDNVFTYEMAIALYSKDDIEVLESSVTKLLVTTRFPYCGNAQVSTDNDIEFVNKMNKHEIGFTIDKIKVI